MDKLLEKEIWQRAGDACEYCKMPQAFYRTRHQIDHIIAQQHQGKTSFENLALAYFPCNNHKGPNLSGIDPVSGKMVRLFNPRRDQWKNHFRWDGPRLVGKTAIGRATVEVLAINHPNYVAARVELINEGVFPPK